jgi:hypothetical protein
MTNNNLHHHSKNHANNAVSGLFTSKLGWYSTLEMKALLTAIRGMDWLWDQDFLTATASYLLLPGISVYIYNHIIVEETIYLEATPEIQSVELTKLFEWKERTGRLMDLSTDFLLEFISLASKHHLLKVVDTVLALLLQISALREVS